MNKMKRQPTEWEDIFINDNTSDKGLTFRIYKKTYTTKHRKKNPV